MTYVYTTSVAALQQSVTAVTTAKVGCLTLQLQYSCYSISCYRAGKAVHVLGVVRQSIKVLAPTQQPLWLRLNQPNISVMKNLLFLFVNNCTSGQMIAKVGF